MDKTHRIINLFLALLCCYATATYASIDPTIQNLKIAYPTHVKDVTSAYIAWQDGTRMQIGGSSALMNWLRGKSMHVDPKVEVISEKDVLHARFEPFFKKMYGKTPREVGRNLVTIYWMPNVFGNRYPLKVTTINGVDKKLRRISANLEKLPPTYYKYLENPGGSFYWRRVEGESALSTHSYGIALDINLRYSNYWLWDYQKTHKPLSDLRNARLSCQNRIPMKIVEIFENEGFFWGGRWYFYDTMHFEYRPDLLQA
jgi:peptidoglycan L-alanyl-D-glutamate endopeptidase CwlK